MPTLPAGFELTAGAAIDLIASGIVGPDDPSPYPYMADSYIDDDVDLPMIPRAIIVGGAGDLPIVRLDGTEETIPGAVFTAMPRIDGLRFRRIKTGGGATGILLLP
jgi:hypothetical protein